MADQVSRLGTILITGGAGIVGSHVSEALLRLPDDSAPQRIVATYHSPKSKQYSCPGVDYRVCDITDAYAVEKLLNDIRPSIIIHTVSPTPAGPATLQYKVNYLATKRLVELATQHETVQALVYTSSLFAVELFNKSSTTPITEDNAKLHTLDSPKKATSAYSRTKAAADALVLASNTGRKTANVLGYGRGMPADAFHAYSGQLLTCVLRLGGLYGERDKKTIGEMLKIVNTPATRFQFGNDVAKHEWLYTANAAQAHVLAVQFLMGDIYRMVPFGTGLRRDDIDGEAFFIADDSPMPFWQFSRRVWKEAGDRNHNSRNPSITKIPFTLALGMVRVSEWLYKCVRPDKEEWQLNTASLRYMRYGCKIDVSNAKTRLFYRPVCNTEEGIKRSVAWYLSEESQSKKT
jgi:sterol-4alpha-carboxylate 3-dehydrogenase (decarboxylating)